MTVAISCNVSDGVILGVDSAATVPAPSGVAKVYENAEKLFQLGQRPIGVAIYGMGAIGARGIGSYLREFEIIDPDKVVSAPASLGAVVEKLREFFSAAYLAVVAPALEQQLGMPYDQIPSDRKPTVGLLLGGFSPNAYLSEVWNFTVRHNVTPLSATQVRGQGDFGTNWFAMFDPIRRYIKGFDQTLLEQLLEAITTMRGGTPFTPDEQAQLSQILAAHEYSIPFGAMPMEIAIDHTRFLVDLVINHHRFASGAPVVGGKSVIGKVTYRGDIFEIL